MAGICTDDYEIEIGNRVAYATPLHEAGPQFQELQSRWLPYYEEPQRQAFDRLRKAFEEFLQGLFIAERTYPLAYNKWLAYQLNLIDRSELYEPLLSVLSVADLHTSDLSDNVKILSDLVDGL